MLSADDIEWIGRLPKSAVIKVFPHNPESVRLFEEEKQKIKNNLAGFPVTVMHGGASDLGISGQAEIDIFVPVPPPLLDTTVQKFTEIYGPSESISVSKRVRFNSEREGVRLEIIVVNEESDGWKKNVTVHAYLKNNSQALAAYQLLKETSNGSPAPEYYRRKIEFINDILGKKERGAS